MKQLKQNMIILSLAFVNLVTSSQAAIDSLGQTSELDKLFNVHDTGFKGDSGFRIQIADNSHFITKTFEKNGILLTMSPDPSEGDTHETTKSEHHFA